MGALLKSKLVIAVAINAALIGLYALLGFKVAPDFIRNEAAEYVRAEDGRELTLGEIHIHPFKLQFEARDISFPDTDGGRMLGLARLFVDFEVSSLWKRAFYFSEVDVESPYVRALIRPDGAMNLADLAPRTSPEAGEDDAPPKVWIADLAVTDRSGSQTWRSPTASSTSWTGRAAGRSSASSLPSRSPCRTSTPRPRAATSV